ncbi:MAG: glucose-phosphatase [Patescibacteria group bacterium]|nr:HAD-IA family hydrolase [Candidatus Saccharibacteria bacterium]MDQ5963381.1 glucose-phosphatase [Patescibacteria group bacterium]
MIRAVLFDLYGVVAFTGWQDFKQKYFADKPEAWERLRQVGKDVDTKRATYNELVSEVAKATGVGVAVVRKSLEEVEVNRELLGCIARELGGLKKAILSNANTDITTKILNDDEAKLFDEIILSATVGFAKPDVRMFEAAVAALDVAPSECIFVDDKIENIQAAEALGMRGIQFETTEQVMLAIAKEITE